MSTREQRLDALKVFDIGCTVLHDTLKQLSKASARNESPIHPDFLGTCDHIPHFQADNRKAELLKEGGVDTIHTLHDAYESAMNHILELRCSVRKVLRNTRRNKSMSTSAKHAMLRQLEVTVALVGLVVSHDRQADSDARIVEVLNLFGDAWCNL